MNSLFTMDSLREAGNVWQETPDYTRFKQAIHRKSGIDLNLYKPQQMHRRLLGMLERAGAATFFAYYQQLECDPTEYAAFLDRLTINVSELFRNPEKWHELRDAILPDLLRAERPLKIWSAGCSYGAEPYSLAMLLQECAPSQPHSLQATDLDRTILAKAREGLFTAEDMKNVPEEMQKRFFTRLRTDEATSYVGPAFQARPELRARVDFRAHNLLSDPFESGYDLICCRNVVIYFTEEAKDRLFAQFARALAPGGLLFVGSTERIFNPRALGLDTPFPFFYRRAA